MDSAALEVFLLSREDAPATKHDLPFSKWEVLVGPSDWKDHSSGKDGAERYRLHNLPGGSSRSGLYELGVDTSQSNDGRQLDEAGIIPVYVGAAGNIRTRLQQYGRDGAHLDHGSSTSHQAGPGLFKKVFERGFPIVFRWVPMGSREEAEKREAELLDKYDYVWNRRGNGPSRRDSFLKTLDDAASLIRQRKEQASGKKPPRGDVSTRASPPREDEHQHHVGVYLSYRPRRVQEPIRSSSPGNTAAKENRSTRGDRPIEGTKLSSEERTTGLVTSTQRPGAKDGMASPGVRLEDDPPVAAVRKEGSKEIPSYSCPTIRVDEDYNIPTVTKGDGSRRGDSRGGKQITIESAEPDITPVPAGRKEIPSNYSRPTDVVTPGVDRDSICGVTREDGSVCGNPPEKGCKRCGAHKGQRVTMSARRPESRSEVTIEGGRSSSFCGVALGDGSVCMESPVCGRKRCEDHKGRRTNAGASLVTFGGLDDWATGFSVSSSSSFCGATTSNGQPCRAAPVPGRKRCAWHKGRRT